MNDSSDIVRRKAEMRREMRALLAAFTPQQIEARSSSLVAWLRSDDSWLEGAGVVAMFGGLRVEPDLLPLLPWLVERGRRVAYFVLGENGVMYSHLVCDKGELVAGIHGVLMPDVSMCPPVNEAELDVVLVPGLAFSFRDGARLGRGKGYYDRVLAKLKPDARVIGVGFSVQMIESIPREPHDQCVQLLVSEDGWRKVTNPV
ncbi:MAG: 5-formyltetrahydrofolate cyclo-ligase [Verrucomicrobia bacterium]|nr:5-formyltetrahydrofolate cyclo-ligase [Verrucomicrobiota bacterium]